MPTMQLRYRASQVGTKVAVVMSSGEEVAYQDLDRRSTRLARALRQQGLETGDTVAILMENQIRYMEVAWAAQRTGLRYVAVNWHLVPEEVDYVLENSEAKALVTSVRQQNTIAALALDRSLLRVSVDGPIPGCQPIDSLVAGVSAEPLSEDFEVEGTEMLYSSGTTGRPKGIRKPLTAAPPGHPSVSQVRIAAGSADRYGQDASSVYLVPAPLYHAAPLMAAMTGTRLGSTVVIMETFDPVTCLELIEHYRVTHVQFVPTMFVRMLRIPEEQRRHFDLTSLRYVIHAAAPCPVDIKRRMIEWLGPIIYEYYSGTEDIGGTFIDSNEWLAHPGSVGRAHPGITIHVLGDHDEELPPRQQGRIFMEGGQRYEYHRDPEKTASIIGPNGWRTLGDIGWLDEDGYLYLTDRASNMIVSGGVNIYPQEIENVLASHPEVADAAVIGIPNEEYGEEVRAVVQPAESASAGPNLEERLMTYCRDHLAGFKCPRAVDFVEALPRDPNGKLYKRRLKDQYWGDRATRII